MSFRLYTAEPTDVRLKADLVRQSRSVTLFWLIYFLFSTDYAPLASYSDDISVDVGLWTLRDF